MHPLMPEMSLITVAHLQTHAHVRTSRIVAACAHIAVCGTSDQCCVHTHNGVSGDVGCSHGVKVMGLKDRKLSSGFGSWEGRERAFRVGSQQLSMENDGMRRDTGHGHDGDASGRST